MTHPRTAAALAAQVRASEVGRRIHNADVDVVTLLVATDPAHEQLRHAAARVTVDRLLRYVPGVGERTVAVVCRRANVDRGLRLGALDPIRRGRIAAELDRFDLAGYSGRGYVRSVR